TSKPRESAQQTALKRALRTPAMLSTRAIAAALAAESGIGAPGAIASARRTTTSETVLRPYRSTTATGMVSSRTSCACSAGQTPQSRASRAAVVERWWRGAMIVGGYPLSAIRYPLYGVRHPSGRVIRYAASPPGDLLGWRPGNRQVLT